MVNGAALAKKQAGWKNAGPDYKPALQVICPVHGFPGGNKIFEAKNRNGTEIRKIKV